ncbi:MAG TPA: hypothetical protein VK249_12785 [Anaerolineales bacterium]|nr:hypothetical protein [Anaerolineales bacterium]
MSERLPVNLVFWGKPFDRAAAVHTVRHLAMRAGWTISSNARHKIIYATLDDPQTVSAHPGDLVILSSPAVKSFLFNERGPIPLSKDHRGRLFPFQHKEAEKYVHQPGWAPSDVIAGIYGILNLWFERRNRSPAQEGWIKYHEDWWSVSGFDDPYPLVDEWLDYIQDIAAGVGWPQTFAQKPGSFLKNPFTLVLTHDVDYLPGRSNKGFPRLVRALARHSITRRKPIDSLRVMANYTNALFKKEPYNDLETIMDIEGSRGVRSSFQVITVRGHRHDPSYKVTDREIHDALLKLHAAGWELALHSSYSASRLRGQIAAERKILEKNLSIPILGHRQHYLNFHPSQLFSEVEDAGLRYDLSVGYNDRSGPRAGTLYPYRPYDIENERASAIWEIPFLFMDTTLATTYRMDPSKIMEHFQSVLKARYFCAAIIWHQEQAGGLLDPGYDQAYAQILDWALGQSVRLTAPGSLLPELENAWLSSLSENYSSIVNS